MGEVCGDDMLRVVKKLSALFSSENSYRWFFLQPFKMLRAIFAAASEMRARKPAFGDKFFLFSLCALTFAYAAMLAINAFIWKSSDLSTAKLSYCYLVYISSVGICAAVLWIVCISRDVFQWLPVRGESRAGGGIFRSSAVPCAALTRRSSRAL